MESVSDQLRRRLKEKLNQKKLQNTQLSTKEKRKIYKQVDDDKKLMQNDKRITSIMKGYYIDAMASSHNVNVINPVNILDDIEKYKTEYYEFLATFMKEVKLDVDLWKTDMMVGYNKLISEVEKEEYMKNLNTEYKNKYKSYFITPYVRYMGLMTGINILKDL
jgi:hypothetical protein